ncbi:glycosyltransferase, partial [Cronobacter sakazakii]
FVKDVVLSCMNEGIFQFVLVDNGSPHDNADILESFLSKLNNIEYHIVKHDKNLGSAGGFGSGLNYACSKFAENSWFLLLDDDNKLEKNAVSALQECINIKGESNAFICLREDRPQYKKFSQFNDQSILLGEPNSFMLFSIRAYIKRRLRMDSETMPAAPRESLIRCPCGPYGGLAINAKDVKKIGFPLNELYLYHDDTEYTLRLQRQGISLWLVKDAKISDLEQSWGDTKPQKKFSISAFEADSFRVHYSYRNRVFIEKKYLVNNKLSYVFNMLLFLGITAIRAFFTNSIKRYCLICKSVWAGWNLNEKK